MNKEFIIPDNLKLPGLKAIFTTRSNGDRDDPLKGLNLSFKGGIDRESVIENRSAVASFFGIPLNSLVLPVQKHTDKVYIIESPLDDLSIEADAIITNLESVILGVLVADCAPILVYNPEKKVAAAVHAGWRGTASGIVNHPALKGGASNFQICLLPLDGGGLRWR